jgi:hypothetical protein
VKITPPSTALPPQLAALSGVWEGDWEGRLDVALVVENINENGGTVIYSVGDYDPWNVRAGHRRYEFSIKEDSIIFSRPTTVFTVKLLNQNTVIIMREAPDSTKETRLKRKQ